MYSSFETNYLKNLTTFFNFPPTKLKTKENISRCFSSFSFVGVFVVILANFYLRFLTDSSEWEALCGYLDSFIEKIIVPKYLPSALSLMNLLLGFSTEDAGSYSAALSCLSSLFCYLTICDEEHRNQYLPKVK